MSENIDNAIGASLKDFLNDFVSGEDLGDRPNSSLSPPPLPAKKDDPEGPPSRPKKRRSYGVQEHLRMLDDRVAKQSLVIQTLLALNIQKGNFDGQEFRELLIELDLQDGLRDGRTNLNTETLVCPKCDRRNSYRRVTCGYCETELGQGISI